MKTVWLWLMLAGVFICQETSAQVWLKTEYIGSSDSGMPITKKVGGKGDMKVIQGGVNIPRIHENGRKQPPDGLDGRSGRFLCFDG